MAANDTPQGCGAHLDSIYYNLCDLTAVWGVVLEAVAAAGTVFSFVLFISLLAGVPFTHDKNRRSAVALHASFLVCTAGLFCLTFAFIVGKDFSTCASRRFLFGVLFGGCFACLLMQCVRLNILARRKDGPRAWLLWLGAVGLWLVEVVINTEWLIITVVRHPRGPLNATVDIGRAAATPCNIANVDFAMALIYVMALILATVLAGLAVMSGKHKKWRKEGILISVAALLSVGVWVAWIVMYVYGNERSGGPAWDDPTLAIALVSNGWVFVILYSIPEICCSSADDESEQDFGNDLYPSRGVGYETILKEQSSQSMFIENKAFSLDEPNQGTHILLSVYRVWSPGVSAEAFRCVVFRYIYRRFRRYEKQGLITLLLKKTKPGRSFFLWMMILRNRIHSYFSPEPDRIFQEKTDPGTVAC